MSYIGQKPAERVLTSADISDAAITTAKLANQAVTYEKVGTGAVLQVVSATYSTATSNTTNIYADTGLTATITPKFATSKILILVSHPECYKTNNSALNALAMNICKNGNQLVQYNFDIGSTVGQAYTLWFSTSYQYLDSPSSNSALTYKTQFKNSEINGAGVGVQGNNLPSSITLMEIAG